MLTSLAEGQMTNSAVFMPAGKPEPIHMKFYAPTVLGPKQRMTPEGFLVCEDVQIARTGELLYVAGEIAATTGQDPLMPGRDGLIRVDRDEAELFNPLTIASFLGKPVTVDHPDDDVTPANWRSYAVGVVCNVRRGEGALSDVLLADLLIQEMNAIAAIRAGKREVSLGYDADYLPLSAGTARQFNIIGNHVALVDKGRCGVRCSIGDSATTSQKKETSMAKRTTWDRIRTAFKAKDEAAFEEELEAAQAASNEGESVQRLVIEVKQPESVDVTTDEEGDPDATTEPTGLEAVMKGIADLSALMQTVCTRLDALEAPDADTTEDDAEELEKKDEEEDGKKKTGDSAALQIEFTQTLARAEILAPGVKLPTFDAKADKKKTADSMCALRRKALGVAFKDDAMRKHVTPFVTKDSADFTKMTCDAVTMAFNGASELAKIANNDGGNQRRTGDASSFRDTASQIGSINKRNADFWAQGRK